MAEQELTKNVDKPECIHRQIEAGANATHFKPVHDHPHYTWKPEQFKWDKRIQARLRSAFFYGYTVMNLFAGTICESIGPRRAVTIGLFFAGIVAVFTTFLAQYHWGFVFGIRVLSGVGTGVIFPSCQVMIARWAPPNEKGKFFISALGGNFGIFLTFSIQGLVTERTNWIVGVIYTTVFALIAATLYFLIVRDYPERHPSITEHELEYLKQQLGDEASKKNVKTFPPLCAIFSNVPFWAYISIQIGNCWGATFLTTSQPQYMADVMGFQSEVAGFYSAIPHLTRAVMGICFSCLGDWIRKKEYCSLTCQRKCFVVLSHIIPGILLSCMVFNDCSVVFAVFLPALTLGFNGCAVLTNLMNPQELSPRFAGTIFGIGNCLGMMSGVIIGELVGFMTKNKSQYALLLAWKYLFIIGGAVYASTGLVFLIFGSTNIQNYVKTQEPAS